MAGRVFSHVVWLSGLTLRTNFSGRVRSGVVMSGRTTLEKSNREDREMGRRGLGFVCAALVRSLSMGIGVQSGGRNDRRSRLANGLDARLSNCWIILR